MAQQLSKPPIPASLQQFIQVLMKDWAMQEQLKAAPDTESFVKLAVELGQQNGYSFTAEDLEALRTQQEQVPVESSTLDEQLRVRRKAGW